MSAVDASEAVDVQRLLETAVALLEVPSPTRDAGAAAEALANLLRADGFDVERVDAGWPNAPAVVTRVTAVAAGPTLQFDGHLDTVHLPYQPPTLDAGILSGSGAADMKAGLAAAVEALRAVRDVGGPPTGGLLLTAHDLHEAPWGYGEQLNALIRAGYVGDAVLLPEYVDQQLPVAGRGMATVTIEVTRDGEPMHEVLGGAEQPDVIAAASRILLALKALSRELSAEGHGIAGRASAFVGSLQSGEIYNQSPVRCVIEGTQRWLAGTTADRAQARLRSCVDGVELDGTDVEVQFQLVRGGFVLDCDHPIVAAFDHAVLKEGDAALPRGPKPFVDDGNSFSDLAGIPAITHGPHANGAHTTDEHVPVEELARVARVYAATAMRYGQHDGEPNDWSKH